ncbi:MAG TPA: hypothetical protein VFA33_07560 [Bryobacteraceae bacterium]|nr:hypothetical protein [Bryobacteraceae bacterium]
MSDFNYMKNLDAIGKKLIDLVGDTIKVGLCTAAYTADVNADEFLSAVGSAMVQAAALTTKSLTGGVFDADDATLAAVPAGSTITQFILYQDTGSPATSRLIRHFDSYSGLPFLTNGLDVVITWPSGSNKIFAFVNA